MDKTLKLFVQVHHQRFTVEHVWSLLKDKPKWNGQGMNNFSKRSSTGTYSSTSNPTNLVLIHATSTFHNGAHVEIFVFSPRSIYSANLICHMSLNSHVKMCHACLCLPSMHFLTYVNGKDHMQQ
jgi:hypothetical protein